MKALQLSKLPIINLDLLFSPPGLPLVPKRRDGVPTTSALVRGAPGVGKTTLAVALAHAIATVNGGVVLYLSSEIAPTELLFKARFLEIEESLVLPWEDRAVGQVGSVLAQHLIFTEEGGAAETVTEQRRSMLASVRTLLATYQTEQRELPTPPIRAVVLDAFGMAPASEQDPALRGQVLDLIQELESEGVSIVLVEEEGRDPTDALAFVVDLSFSLSFVPDPDTGEMLRKLRCGKSRFIQCHPGPHDYGVDGKRPAVWPDPLRVAAEVLERFALPARKRFWAVLPGDEPGEYEVLGGGTIGSSSKVWSALSLVPGASLARLDCGPITRLRATKVTLDLLAADGPYNLGWTLLRAIHQHSINVLAVDRLDQLRTQHRYRAPMLSVLESLRLAGVTVLLGSGSQDLASMLEFKDRDPIAFDAFPSTRYRLAAHWLTSVPEPAGVLREDSTVLHALCAAVQGLLATGEVRQALRLLDGEVQTEFGHVAQLFHEWRGDSAAPLRLLQALHRFGATERVSKLLPLIQAQAPAELLAAYYTSVGDDENALEVIVESATVSSRARDLYAGLCAVYAQSTAALEQIVEHSRHAALVDVSYRLRALSRLFADPDSPYHYDDRDDFAGWLEGLYLLGESNYDSMDDDVIRIPGGDPEDYSKAQQEDLAQRRKLLKTIEGRIRAEEALLLPEDQIPHKDLIRPLERQARDEALPRIHRVESLYNLALTKEALRKRADAISHAREILAMTENTYEPARELLRRLDETF